MSIDLSGTMGPTASRVFGLAAIAGPVLLLGSTIAFISENGINDGVIGGMIGIWSTFALAVAFTGIYRMIEPAAPRVGPIFGAIALVGFTAGALFNLQAMYLAAYGNDLLTDTMNGALPDVPAITFFAFLPWGWLAPLSFVATGILLWRTRTAPTWSAAMLVLGGILFIASRPARVAPLAIACDLALVLALAPIGWAMLARRRVVADVMPSTASS
ncbi:hypothetical protein EV643_1563 [Kribbella sp. VKM Ac-2527]|uniref:Uncharacterized protein n=1 Tax=Kribbella caucasensis TaxID=2512215 RepID=A0A4R6IXM3_9ACTN|nr:hypothetical protein [Kribbella sp. VKM Ac-2527]TDO27519.1 hypothetical protein EV643_1563 [Kribbella sp. VKM Ac-2527]